MLATHSTKLINAKAQQEPICADIIDILDKRLITSQSTQLTKKHWACPKNAPDIKWQNDR